MTDQEPVDQAVFQANLIKNMELEGAPGFNPGLQQQAEAEQQAKPLGELASDLWEAVKTQSPTNKAYQFVKTLGEATYDPDFDPKNYPEMYQGIDASDAHVLDGTVSLSMMQRQRDLLLEDYQAAAVMRNSGAYGAAASITAGLLDPINVGSMIIAPEMALANKIRGTSRLAGMARGAVGGAVGAAGFQAGVTMIDATGHWTDVFDAAMYGGAFGTVLGAAGVFKDPELRHAQDSMQDWSTHIHENAAKTEASAKINPQTTWKAPRMDPEGSIGAGYVGEAGEMFNPDGISEQTLKARTAAKAFIAENGLAEKWEDAWDGTAFGAGPKAKAVYDAEAKTLFGDLYGKAWNSGSMLLREDIYKLAENPTGALRNNTSGIMMRETFRPQMLQGISDPNIGYDASFALWLKEEGLIQSSNNTVTDLVNNQLKMLDHKLRRKFNKEVLSVRNDVHLGKITDYELGSSKKSIINLNKALDKDADSARGIMQKSGVRGAEVLTPEDSKGHFSQHIDGKELNARIVDGTVKEDNIIQALMTSYRGLYSTLSEDAISTLAKAQVRRGRSMAQGMDTNMYRMLSEDGELYLRKYLTDSLGVSGTQADSIVSGLRNVKPETEKAGFLRNRRSFDWNTPIPGTDLTLLDFMHTDIPAMWNHYTNRVAGMSALSKVGYQYGDIEARINNVMEELSAVKNSASTLTHDDVRNLYQAFIGGPIYGAPPVAVRRGLSLAATALYGGMGVWQALETSAGLAAFGYKKYFNELKNAYKKADQRTIQQVEHLVAGVRGEERLYMEKYQYDQFQQDAPALAEMGNWADRALAAGRHIQGTITGFFFVRKLQQQAGIRCMLNALADTFDGIETLSPARLQDLGADERTVARLSKYFTGDTKVVTRYVTPEGAKGVDLQLDKWDPEDELALGTILNRSVNQIVQKAMLGETSPFMNKIVGSIMMQGNGFTLLSINKQTLRNLRLGNEPTQMALLYGLALGTAGYTATQALAGNLDALTPVEIIKGGLSNSSMSSWAPMFWDTPMSLLGLNSLKLNPYNFNPRTDILGVPPALTTLNSMLHLPMVPVHAVTGTFSNNDVVALKSLPLIGNHFLFKGLWNSMKDN